MSAMYEKGAPPVEWPALIDANIAILAYQYQENSLCAWFLGAEIGEENDAIRSHDTCIPCDLNTYGTIMELINDDTFVRIPAHDVDIYINPRLFRYRIVPTADGSMLIINAHYEEDNNVFVKHAVISIDSAPWSITRKVLRDIAIQYGGQIVISSPGAVIDLSSEGISATMNNADNKTVPVKASKVKKGSASK